MLTSKTLIERLNHYEQENKELTERIEFFQRKSQRLEKRNKEIYDGFMASNQELCDNAKEISRLNNIIDEIEKFTKDRIEYCYGSDSSLDEFNVYNEYDELISELKEGK